MKMLIRSYRRPERLSTLDVAAFGDLEKIVLVHSDDEAEAYHRGPHAGSIERLHVTGVPTGRGGQTRQFEAGLRELAEPGEWIVLADDDILALQAVPEPYYHVPDLPVHGPPLNGRTWTELYQRSASVEEFDRIIAEGITRAEKIGARVVGFGTTKNPYFRGKKWRTAGYVMGGLRLWRYDPRYEFDHSITMDDFRDSAEHLRRYGTVLINNYVHALCGMYIDGGLGRHEDRLEDRERDLIALNRAYPGLFRVARKGPDDYPDLRFRISTPEQIERWRRFGR